MSSDIRLLGTQPKESQPEVQQCILPLVVLFSIAAQENRARAGIRRRGTYYPMIPGRGPVVRQGMGAARSPVGAPMMVRPGIPVQRRGWY